MVLCFYLSESLESRDIFLNSDIGIQNGLSVPDADMLICIADVLETPVSTLLGESIKESKADDLKVISQKLETINLQLAQRKIIRQRIVHGLFISLLVIIVIIFALLAILNSPYLIWNYSNPEIAVAGTIFHVFEWLFIRLAPFIVIGIIAGIILTRKKA